MIELIFVWVFFNYYMYTLIKFHIFMIQNVKPFRWT